MVPSLVLDVLQSCGIALVARGDKLRHWFGYNGDWLCPKKSRVFHNRYYLWIKLMTWVRAHLNVPNKESLFICADYLGKKYWHVCWVHIPCTLLSSPPWNHVTTSPYLSREKNLHNASNLKDIYLLRLVRTVTGYELGAKSVSETTHSPTPGLIEIYSLYWYRLPPLPRSSTAPLISQLDIYLTLDILYTDPL